MKIRKVYIVVAILFLPVLCIMCRKAGTFDESDFDPRLSGGAATVFDETSRAFGHPFANLSDYDQYVHNLGDVAIEQSFVTAPAPINSGLGPVFNNVSCISCHHNDGKGNPTAGLVNSSLLIRLSVAGVDAHGGPLPIPGFGLQLQDLGVFGKNPEAKVNISYTETSFTLNGGETIILKKPVYHLSSPYKPLSAGYLFSPRMAPSIFGLGLLENIPESTILSLADEHDRDGNGISGKPNYVFDAATGRMMLGRFGLKANTATILTQVAAAYQQDMGITNSLFPDESCYGQPQYDELHDDIELPDSMLRAATFYIKTLAVPARRNVTDPIVLKGQQLFNQIQCSSCHIPTMQTGTNVTLRAISNQRIHPYTDLLLHDMGNELADNRPDFAATGTEWKTPALWGIGLLQKTNGTPFYLHDGRARTLTEAILWHGGEGENSKNAFTNLSPTDRKALIRFLQSL